MNRLNKTESAIFSIWVVFLALEGSPFYKNFSIHLCIIQVDLLTLHTLTGEVICLVFLPFHLNKLITLCIACSNKTSPMSFNVSALILISSCEISVENAVCILRVVQVYHFLMADFLVMTETACCLGIFNHNTVQTM